MQETIETLKKCLNGGKCAECEYGKEGQPMMCCKELIKKILDGLENKNEKTNISNANE